MNDGSGISASHESFPVKRIFRRRAIYIFSPFKPARGRPRSL
jgi:hypothetical protein